MTVVFSTFAFRPLVTSAKSPDRALVADFNSGDKPNNLGFDWGAWNKEGTLYLDQIEFQK